MSRDLLKVLVVDDHPGNLLSLKVILEPMGIAVYTAKSGNEALSLLLKHQFGLALLDVEMPDMNGFEMAELMMQLEETRYVPIIFLTANANDQFYLYKGYEVGAVDYISKPCNEEILKSKVKIFLRMFHQKELLLEQQKSLKLLLDEKESLIHKVEEQNDRKDKLLIQINEQNLAIRRLTKLKFSIFGILLFSLMGFFYLLSIEKKNKELLYNTNQLITANKFITDLNNAYKRFIPYDILNLLGKESIIDVSLNDQVLREMIVLFIDVRGYSSIAENLSPQENITLLNELFSVMQNPIEEYHGIINKYLGDGLMALFIKEPEEALRASIKIIKDLEAYSRKRQENGQPPIKVGIGMDGGQMIVGTVGNNNRMEQTVVADAVNVASRIEGMTKMYNATILISEYVYNSLKNAEKYAIRYMDKVLVKGRSKPVIVYQVFDGENGSTIDLFEKTKDHFAEAIHLFNDHKFPEAQALFEKVLEINPNDQAAICYHSRCQSTNLNLSLAEDPLIRKLEIK